MLFEAVDFNLFLPEGRQLFFTRLHISMNGFAGDGEVAHERQNLDAFIRGESVISQSGGSRGGEGS